MEQIVPAEAGSEDDGDPKMTDGPTVNSAPAVASVPAPNESE